MDGHTSDRAPSLECHLCELSFDALNERRQHAKSEWHVYRIRCTVADPGTVVTPPDSMPKQSQSRPKDERKSRWPPETTYLTDERGELDISSDEPSSEEGNINFLPEECLFCNNVGSTFDDNLKHMHQAHGFVVPFQSSLTTDLQTLIAFLHIVIFSYRECIGCGKRRHTVEAVQHHMTSKGHCRFDIAEEMGAFYGMRILGKEGNQAESRYLDNETLRLPSGKLLAHRSYVHPTPKSRLRKDRKEPLPEIPISENHRDSQVLSRKDRQDGALERQLANLSTSDQMSLRHLPQPQQRSILLAQKKELDKANRAATRRERRLEQSANKLAVHCNYYKQEVPVYMAG
ncbi:C2H2 type zinc-finger-domain-containing protein [Emericellopsis atlantica]|uniref:C2H2 type zinc-finger-domain-containing protein n=1 Tax=Emericellopsis atlantica TaxID=2614577 RepID=A0A9P7ZFH0_9HYPO|nr:C2H2 type zinc-finger-domain-containing protein [Emericellopsis atlantica]KAG9250976.1 C2H2 type zinc-finger-domain-containing protein [Emericellopsis atlantica]